MARYTFADWDKAALREVSRSGGRRKTRRKTTAARCRWKYRFANYLLHKKKDLLIENAFHTMVYWNVEKKEDAEKLLHQVLKLIN